MIGGGDDDSIAIEHIIFFPETLIIISFIL